MPTGTVGSTAREFHHQMIHYLRKTIEFADAGTDITVGVIPPGSLIIPALSGAHVTEAFNGSTGDTLDVGDGTTAQQFASALDVSAIGLVTLDSAYSNMLVSESTTIVANYTDATGDASAGSMEVLIAYIPDNDG